MTSATDTIYAREWRRQTARDDVPAGHLPVHRWYLAIDDPSRIETLPPPRPDLALRRAGSISIEFYRFLYHTVGEHYLWADRRRRPDDELLALIDRPKIEVQVLYRDDTPAGFFELDFHADDHNELAYFGLLPSFVGQGLGGYMLNRAIVRASERRPLRLTVNTCTLDHARALDNYRKLGFEIVREADEVYPDPRLDGSIAADAAPQIAPPARR